MIISPDNFTDANRNPVTEALTVTRWLLQYGSVSSQLPSCSFSFFNAPHCIRKRRPILTQISRALVSPGRETVGSLDADADTASATFGHLQLHTSLLSRRHQLKLETRSCDRIGRHQREEERNTEEEGLVVAADGQRIACEYPIVLNAVGEFP